MPLRRMEWGAPLASSVIVREAVRLPVHEGVKTTPNVQFKDGAKLAGQELAAIVKSLELEPEMPKLVSAIGSLPVF